MATIEYDSPKATYFSVLADGKFHTTVPEGTEGAVRRDYETSDKKTGVKFERLAQSITGIIESLSIFEGDFGKNVILEFKTSEGVEPIIISLSSQSSYAEDFLKKLPNIDTAKEIELVPYAFEADGKKKKGLTVYQDGKKISGAYHEQNPETKQFVTVKGYPAVPDDRTGWDKEDWKIYFAQARKFLLGELQKHPLFNSKTEILSPHDYPADEVEEVTAF